MELLDVSLQTKIIGFASDKKKVTITCQTILIICNDLMRGIQFTNIYGFASITGMCKINYNESPIGNAALNAFQLGATGTITSGQVRISCLF